MNLHKLTDWVTLNDIVRSCEIRKTLNAEPIHLRIERSQPRSLATWPECHGKGWQREFC